LAKTFTPAFAIKESDEILILIGFRETDFIIKPLKKPPDLSPLKPESESGATV
jgi:hypothetical protein